MNKKAKAVYDLWEQSKAGAYLWENTMQKIDFGFAKELFISSLESKNFKCIGDGGYKLVFTKRSVDFVVKIYHTGSIDDKEDGRFKLSKYTIKPWYRDKYIAIQLKAIRTNKHKAYKIIESKLGSDYCELFDVHPDNVGWLNNEAVIFDYVACGGTNA